MEKWVKTDENLAKCRQNLPGFEWVCRQWLDLTARVMTGSCVQSGGWDHPVYSEYYIPRTSHGAASHISQTSGFLHLLTSGQQPHFLYPRHFYCGTEVLVEAKNI